MGASSEAAAGRSGPVRSLSPPPRPHTLSSAFRLPPHPSRPQWGHVTVIWPTDRGAPAPRTAARHRHTNRVFPSLLSHLGHRLLKVVGLGAALLDDLLASGERHDAGWGRESGGGEGLWGGEEDGSSAADQGQCAKRWCASPRAPSPILLRHCTRAVCGHIAAQCRPGQKWARAAHTRHAPEKQRRRVKQKTTAVALSLSSLPFSFSHPLETHSRPCHHGALPWRGGRSQRRLAVRVAGEERARFPRSRAIARAAARRCDLAALAPSPAPLSASSAGCHAPTLFSLRLPAMWSGPAERQALLLEAGGAGGTG